MIEIVVWRQIFAAEFQTLQDKQRAVARLIAFSNPKLHNQHSVHRVKHLLERLSDSFNHQLV